MMSVYITFYKCIFRPMYCQVPNSFACNDIDDPLRVGKFGLEQMFAENKVDIEIWGHVHNYQRSFPLFNHTFETQPKDIYTDPKYPVHVITG